MRVLGPLAALGLAIGSVQPSAAQDFDQLSKELTSADREVRREAAFQLRELGAGALPALPALIEALRDDDEQVAARALMAIAHIGPEADEAIPALIGIMDPDRRRYDEQVVFRAAFAISQIGEPAVGALREALKSSSNRRRYGAAQALQLLGEAAVPAIPELIVAIHDDEPEVRRAAAEALGAIGVPALEPLLADLGASPTAAGVQAIGLIGQPANSASGRLFELLAKGGDEPSLRPAIIAALGAIEAPFERLQSELRSGIADSHEPVRRAAADVLLSYPDPAQNSLPVLREWLANGERELRGRSAWVVGQFGADAAGLASALIGRLESGDEPEPLTTALSALGAAATGTVLQALEKAPLSELQQDGHWSQAVLGASGILSMSAFERGLGSEHASTRFVSLEAIAALGKTARSLEPKLRRASGDEEAAVRLAALRALEGIGAEPQRLATILRRRCADDSGAVRAVAVRLLGETADSDRSAFELIDNALSDSDPAVREAAVGALENVGSGAKSSVPKLLELAEGAAPPMKLAILRALKSIGSEAGAALPMVRESLGASDPELRGAAISALVAIEPDRSSLTEVLAKMLADENQAVRHPAIAGLGEIGEPAASAAPVLFQLLEDESDRAEVLEALRSIRSRNVDLYIKALDSREPRVRLFACEALGRLGSEAEKAIPALEHARRDRYDFVRRRASDAISRIRG